MQNCNTLRQLTFNGGRLKVRKNMHLLLVPNRARDAKRRKITVLELRFYDTRKNFKDLDAYKIEKKMLLREKRRFCVSLPVIYHLQLFPVD